MVHDLRVVGEQGGERVGVAGGERGVEARRVRGRGVRSHPARALRARPRRRGCDRAGGSRRQLVEAGERLGVAVGIELLAARHEAIGSEDPEHEEGPLEGAAAGAVGAEVRPAHEERVGSQAEDVVDAGGAVVGELEQGAERAAGPLRLRARTGEPDGAVVDELDVGRERRAVAIEVERSQQRRDRARRRRGAVALGAVGEELGVALVQPGDGVAQPVGGEDLGPPASSAARRPRSDAISSLS